MTLSGQADRLLVIVTRALETDRPELTGPRQMWTYTTADEVEAAAREVAQFMRTLE